MVFAPLTGASFKAALALVLPAETVDVVFGTVALLSGKTSAQAIEKVSQDLPKQVGGLFHAGSVGIIMSGWLGAVNYGVIVSNEVDKLDELSNQCQFVEHIDFILSKIQVLGILCRDLIGTYLNIIPKSRKKSISKMV